MTRYLLANVFGLLLLLAGLMGAAVCIYEIAGWAGQLLVACLAVLPAGRRLATLAPPAGNVQGYTYERDAR